MRMRFAAGAGVLALVALAVSASAQQSGGVMPTQLKKFNVTIRRFDPARGAQSGEEFVLPVDSPDAEHAVSSTMANAVSFTTKVQEGKPLPVAFTCVRVEPRPD